MRPEGRPRGALAWVALVSLLVDPGRRRRWRAEWEGELLGRWSELEARGATGLGAHADMLWRALGCVPDAVTMRREGAGMSGFGLDLVVASRSLARRPGFTAVVSLTLAVGIGATTSIYTVARDVLLRPFPYPDADRVVALEGFRTGRGGAGHVTYPNLADLAERTTSFSQIALSRWWDPAIEDDRGAFVARGAIVTGNFFELLGLPAGQGRFFRADEQGSGRPAQVVLGHRLWTSRFGADSSIVGRDLRVNGVAYTVIGVTGPDFEDPWLMGGPGEEPEIWTTVDSPPSRWPRGGRSWVGIARVRPSVSARAAQEELTTAWAGLVEAYPEANAEREMRITPLRERIAGPVRPVLLTLLGAVGLLLLVACANLASLMLGRAMERDADVRIQRALGAPRWRVVNRGAAEVAVLSLLGGTLGVALSVALASLASRLDGRFLPRQVGGGLDATMLLFGVTVTAGAALLFGVFPTWHTARSHAAPAWGTRSTTAGRAGHRMRRSLVVAELALTVALLVTAGLVGRSLHRLGQVDLGLVTEGVTAIRLHGSAWWALEADEARAKWAEVLAAVRAVPGVTGAGAIDYVPLGGSYSCDGVWRTDQPPPEPGQGECAEVRVVLPGALESLDVPLLRGRMLGPEDGRDDRAVVVVDRDFADAFFPDVDPLGQVIRVHEREHTVVGIVGAMRHFGPAGRDRPMLYLHAPQEGWNGIARGLSLLVRSRSGAPTEPRVLAAVASVDPAIAVGAVEPLDRLLDRSLAAWRFRTVLLLAFATTAVFLAGLGIAGVMGYAVSRRRRELGVRLALGARPSEVRWLVLREGLRLTVAGAALGLFGAWTLSGLQEAMLFQVGARDPLVYAGVTVLLGLVAMAGCWLPARRASGIDPVRTLGES